MKARGIASTQARHWNQMARNEGLRPPLAFVTFTSTLQRTNTLPGLHQPVGYTQHRELSARLVPDCEKPRCPPGFCQAERVSDRNRIRAIGRPAIPTHGALESPDTEMHLREVRGEQALHHVRA